MLSPGCTKHLTEFSPVWPRRRVSFETTAVWYPYCSIAAEGDAMPLTPSRASVFLTLTVLGFPLVAAPSKKSLLPEALAGAVLWQDPGNIASRDLYYGPGGETDQPHGPFTFEKEDLDGSNPKFVVRDRDGVKWKVKLGTEARPETVASRIVWAVGYFTDEDYFLPDFKVQEMPRHLHRG